MAIMRKKAQSGQRGIYLKSASEIDTMRRAGRMLHRVMDEVITAAVEGVTTLELDKLAHSRIQEARAKPAFLGLYNFPNTLCISLNEEVVHGIPSKRKLETGDLVSIDCGLILNGLYADMAYSVPIGEVSEEVRQLMHTTRLSLHAGITAARVGARVGDIGAAVEKIVHAAGLHCIQNYTGHGIGRRLHEDPKVYNTSCERGKQIRSGLTVAIEPMVAIGTGKTRELDDEWTVVTEDRSFSAHYEHTVAVTDGGVEILTLDPSLDDADGRWSLPPLINADSP